MASDFPHLTENSNLSDDLRTRKSLRSAVITENDPLKIRLKISKRDIMEPVKSKKEAFIEAKANRNHRSSNNVKFDEKCASEGSEQDFRGCEDELKMKLRSKREVEDDMEQKMEDSEEGKDDRRRKIQKCGDESFSEPNENMERRRLKKRGRPTRFHADESERLDEKRRLKRLGVESVDGEKNYDDCKGFRESFCWACHKAGSVVKCDTCPRVFHLKCVSLSKDPSKDWICPECSLVLHAEKMSTRSEAMKNLSLDQLCTLLNFAIGRMKNVPESQAFWKAVDPKEVPYYDKYITNPMNLSLLEKNMKAKMYGSPQAFLADAKWLLHNSIIFNSNHSPLTSTARFLVKICKQEMAEIENCPDCYLNAHTKKEWFVEVCRKPHILIWARLKGFPFWPAKAMSTNFKTQSVDARFFGAHDKAWVPVKECYLYSKNSPQLLSKKRADLDDAFVEVESYIKKIKQKYGVFIYAPDKTPFLPEIYDKQLETMIPSYQEEKLNKKKRKRQNAEENGVVEKNTCLGKKPTENGSHNRLKLKYNSLEETVKVSDDICLMNDYISEEKILSEDKISPEDEVARTLEMFDTADKTGNETVDENSTDIEEDSSVPIPEHGYSRSVDPESHSESISNKENTTKSVEFALEVSNEKQETKEETCNSKDSAEECREKSELRVQEIPNVPNQVEEEDHPQKEPENDQCVVSSTSAECAEVSVDVVIEGEKTQSNKEDRIKTKRQSKDDVQEKPATKTNVPEVSERKENEECSKKDDDRSIKSFTNLTVDQKHKILTEAKLLANIDEMTALGKQKILNELGLDASQIDIRQLAEENRHILETLNKKGHNETKNTIDIPIKSEDFEQYLMEESIQEGEEMENDMEEPPIQMLAPIVISDVHSLPKSPTHLSKNSCEPPPKRPSRDSIPDLKSNKKDLTIQQKKFEDSSAKKMKLEPVIELIKLDTQDKSIEKLNRKLKLSDEVSLLRVEGDKKTAVTSTDISISKLPVRKLEKPPRARKSIPNRTRRRDNHLVDAHPSKQPPKNINIISVDTENSSAQKNLLKSLCVDDRRVGDDDNSTKTGKKTVLITTGDNGIRNVNVTTETDDVKTKTVNGVTIESVSNKGNAGVQDGVTLNQQKNLAVVANSHLILTNSGPTFLTNQNNQPNLALAQNNLGQLSLVHLTNLTSGIQTNFVNLANETIGLNNSIGTIYATPSFNADGICSSISAAPNGSVLITTTSSPSVTCPPSSATLTVSKSTKGEGSKSSVTRSNAARPNPGISVKSPASLGLVASPSNKAPPIVTKPGEEGLGQVGSVTAELNRHSIKMAEYMRATIEDILRELSNQGSLEAKYKSLTIEMEKLQWKHQQEIMELKHHSERSLMELRTTLESEKQKCLAELKSQLEARHQKIISETKNKQWCANCGKEALFYCCWNTSYCDYPCQQQHWPGHMSRCAQLGNNVHASNQLQNKNPGLKYINTSYVPMISRGGGPQTSGTFVPNRTIPSVQFSYFGKPDIRKGEDLLRIMSKVQGKNGCWIYKPINLEYVGSLVLHQGPSQGRRSSDPSTPQVPINITIRPQHYFM